MSINIRPVIALLFGIVLFIGLPFVGWGITDIRGFVGNPARLGYIIITILTQIIVVIVIPDVGRNRGKGNKIIRRQHLALILIQTLSIAIVMAAPYSDRRGIAVLSNTEIFRYIGLGLYALGLFGVHWAEMALGKQFSSEVVIQEGHQLVTNGPYRYLRHPRYLGIIIFYIGISLVFRSWPGMILLAALISVLLWRIHDEEALLHREFGADWEAYSGKTWRLIPFLY
jgi:protein-S-isoprenylcysteine O-methyltransferase Ste14